MIRHIVFFTVQKDEDKDAVYEGLSLLTQISHARHLEIGRNCNVDAISDRVDFVVYGEFADEAALEAYKHDPLYAEAIRRVRPLRDMRIAADFVAKG